MTNHKDMTEPGDIDGVLVAPDSHQVLFENETVRVLNVTIKPGQREPIHTHQAGGFMISLTTSKLLYDAFKWENGDWVRTSSDERTTQKGRGRWIPCEGPHAVENLDDRPAQAIRIECLDQPGDLTADPIVEGAPVYMELDETR